VVAIVVVVAPIIASRLRRASVIARACARPRPSPGRRGAERGDAENEKQKRLPRQQPTLWWRVVAAAAAWVCGAARRGAQVGAAQQAPAAAHAIAERRKAERRSAEEKKEKKEAALRAIGAALCASELVTVFAGDAIRVGRPRAGAVRRAARRAPALVGRPSPRQRAVHGALLPPPPPGRSRAIGGQA